MTRPYIQHKNHIVKAVYRTNMTECISLETGLSSAIDNCIDMVAMTAIALHHIDLINSSFFPERLDVHWWIIQSSSG